MLTYDNIHIRANNIHKMIPSSGPYTVSFWVLERTWCFGSFTQTQEENQQFLGNPPNSTEIVVYCLCLFDAPRSGRSWQWSVPRAHPTSLEFIRHSCEKCCLCYLFRMFLPKAWIPESRQINGVLGLTAGGIETWKSRTTPSAFYLHKGPIESNIDTMRLTHYNVIGRALYMLARMGYRRIQLFHLPLHLVSWILQTKGGSQRVKPGRISSTKAHQGTVIEDEKKEKIN